MTSSKHIILSSMIFHWMQMKVLKTVPQNCDSATQRHHQQGKIKNTEKPEKNPSMKSPPSSLVCISLISDLYFSFEMRFPCNFLFPSFRIAIYNVCIISPCDEYFTQFHDCLSFSRTLHIIVIYSQHVLSRRWAFRLYSNSLVSW